MLGTVHWILREMTIPGAQHLVQLWIRVVLEYLAFGRIFHCFYVDVDSEPEVFFLRSRAESRSVLGRCLRLLPMHALLTHESGVSTSCTWLAVCMMMSRVVGAHHTGDELN